MKKEEKREWPERGNLGSFLYLLFGAEMKL
jgi:hypothetical protein